jgi:hypothetical protein
MSVRRLTLSLTAIATVLAAAAVQAHSGPPFPLVTDRVIGPYQISVWTDPDATDDGSAAGQFWVVVRPAGQGTVLPQETQAVVSIASRDRSGSERKGPASPVNHDVTRQFIALVMDHEGPFSVHVSIDGPLGSAGLAAEVDATYDLRPPPIMLLVYVMPFVLVGFLWFKLLLRRRRGRSARKAVV